MNKFEVQKEVYPDHWKNYYNGKQFDTYVDAFRAYVFELLWGLHQYDMGLRGEPLMEEYLAVVEVEE